MTIEEMRTELLEIWNKHNPDKQATEAGISTENFLYYPDPLYHPDEDPDVGVPAVRHYPQFMVGGQWFIIPVIADGTHCLVSEDIPEAEQYEILLNVYRMEYKEFDHMSSDDLLKENSWVADEELDRRIRLRRGSRRMSSQYFKMQMEWLTKQIDLGAQKIAVMFYRAFPTAALKALTEHPLYQKKDSGTLYFENGSTVTFVGHTKETEFKPDQYKELWHYHVQDWDNTPISPEVWEKLQKRFRAGIDWTVDEAQMKGKPEDTKDV